MDEKDTATQLREAEERVALLRAQRAREVATSARRRVQDVRAFQALSDEERLDLYGEDREMWRHFMAEWQEEAEKHLGSSEGVQRGGGAS